MSLPNPTPDPAHGATSDPVLTDALDARGLRDALGRFATGVCVITAQGPDGPQGFTANSFAAVSLDPALVLWSPAKASRRHDLFVEARAFAIHVLGEGQRDLGRRFTSGLDGFAGLPTLHNPEAVPVLDGCLARFDCAREALLDGGDHTIVLGRVLRASMRDGAPLVFSAGRYGTFAPD